MGRITRTYITSRNSLSLLAILCSSLILVVSLFSKIFIIHYPLATTIMVGSITAIVFWTIHILWIELFVTLCLSLLIAFLSVVLYQNQLENIHHSFWLKYFLSSQCLIGWMLVMFVMATIIHWLDIFKRVAVSRTKYTWLAVGFGLSGLLVRWYESYLMGQEIGHVPISNLYEVFILFMIITALVYLWYEKKLEIRNLGALILPIVVIAGLFMIWYGTTRKSYLIVPLSPSLQSYWMKIHVPANFVGYGCFSAAAMSGVAWIIKDKGWIKALPTLQSLETLIYKLISTGFLFFTLATILGALWAADAWGSYWQWDPKETWSLIVWLNYAAWLHACLINNVSHKILSWWAIIGLFITLFAFLGVNILLSGLHSYGRL